MSVELELVHGVWVPQREAYRFATYGEYEGLLDIDVKKSVLSVPHCLSHDLALDVGAHVGAVSIQLAKHFASVVAFEPIDEPFAALTKNIEPFPHVIAHKIALSDKPGELRFEYVPTHTQLSHVVEVGEDKHFGEKSVIVGPFEARTIDSFAFEKVSFIKIDVEGTELDVIRGGMETIRRCRPTILVEQHGNEEKFHNRLPNEASLALEGLGMVRVEGLPFWKDFLYRFP